MDLLLLFISLTYLRFCAAQFATLFMISTTGTKLMGASDVYGLKVIRLVITVFG